MKYGLERWRDRSLEPRTRFFDEFEKFFEDFWRPLGELTPWNGERKGVIEPACDIEETGDRYLVTFDMPGVSKNDINIDLKGNQLTVTAERKRENKSDEGGVQRYERSYGQYQRSFELPDSVKVDNVEARYEDGVLHISIPKAEEVKGRKIEILEGKASHVKSVTGKKEKEEEKKH